jgi:hypothetical protein
MPTTKEELPSTIARSSEKVQRTYAEALDIEERSKMSKEELVEALRKHYDRETARARRRRRG